MPNQPGRCPGARALSEVTLTSGRRTLRLTLVTCYGAANHQALDVVRSLIDLADADVATIGPFLSVDRGESSSAASASDDTSTSGNTAASRAFTRPRAQ